jgi:5S rRNA maturation endonuclease (ribonuclease M5)
MRTHDEEGRVVKEKLRFADKKFQWRTYVKRSKPLLYNAHLVQFARTVAVVEGEKDADTVASLHLKDEWGHEIVGTTSGSATSWKDGHANALRDKRAIILPDSDEPGQKYADAIAESLIKRNIEFRMVSFAPDGVNDVSDYLETHIADDLVAKIGEIGYMPIASLSTSKPDTGLRSDVSTTTGSAAAHCGSNAESRQPRGRVSRPEEYQTVFRCRNYEVYRVEVGRLPPHGILDTAICVWLILRSLQSLPSRSEVSPCHSRQSSMHGVLVKTRYLGRMWSRDGVETRPIRHHKLRRKCHK